MAALPTTYRFENDSKNMPAGKQKGGAARTLRVSRRSSPRDSSLSVNDAPPAVGRSAIAEVARGFMTTFPDMIVTFDKLEARGDRTALSIGH